MGTVIAIGILWYWISRSTPPATRRAERRVVGAAMLGSALWLLEGIWNADKYRRD